MADATPQHRDDATMEPLVAAYLAGEPTAGECLVAAYGGVVRDAIARFLAMRVRSRLELAEK